MTKVALITGGTSGIGYAVAEDLSKTGIWHVNILGSNQERGEKAAASLQNTTFYQADVRDYDQLASVFDQIFNTSQRLDFVFANAGVAEYHDHFAKLPDTGIPPKPNTALVDINLSGAINTGYLAMHYFRRSPESTKGERDLIFTSSIGGLYPCALSPIYSGTKHAMTGYVRSIAPRLWSEGIRVNAICPGVVATPLFNSGDGWDSIFDKEIFIEMKVVTGVVAKLLAGTDLVDGKGTLVRSDELYSRALHISGDAFFFVEMPEFHDEKAPMTWKSMMGR